MVNELPKRAQVIIVGGGVIGCSIAYHLTKIGWQDVVLLERKKLTSGTTWHAAGLIGQLRDNQNMTKLAKYTAELYLGLEEETGQSTGYKVNGSLSIATNEGRLEDLKRRADMAKVFDLHVDVINPKDCLDFFPLMNIEDILGGIFIPSDGQANPIDVTQALAKGARLGGALIYEDTCVEHIEHDGERVLGVETDAGPVQSDFVVMCCGMWTREFAKKINVNVPLHACEHFYVVTEPIPEVTPDFPVFRDYDASAYFKEDTGKLLIGAFESDAKPWGMRGIPEDFCFDELPDDFDHFQPILEGAIHRVPILNKTGIQKFFCGPESFTPDDRYQIGMTPELKNLFVAAGLNSIGIQSAGGIGKVIAEWIRDGHPPSDLASVDVRRNMPFQSNPNYLHDRVKETLGLLYDVHWPFYQYKTARNVRKSPLHQFMKEERACFGEAAGWERPSWFAPKGVEAKDLYTFGKQNWFEFSAQEHQSVRENVGLLDLTAFAKFRVEGRDAEKELNLICSNNLAVTPGQWVYTQCLNDRGGIEADFTVTRVSSDVFLIITSGSSQVRDFSWLKSKIDPKAHCVITDITSALAVIGIQGPKSRDLLQGLTSVELSNSAFPFRSSAEIDIGYAFVRASRISYMGELGWELYIPSEFSANVYSIIKDSGKEYGLRPVGAYAMNSLRMEKKYCHWGHDITDEETPLEAGLGFAINWEKRGGFLGLEALRRQKGTGLKKMLVQFLLEDNKKFMYHNEPIYRDGVIAGYITSAMFGHTLGSSVGLGYVENKNGVDAQYIKSGFYQIEVGGEKVGAKVSLVSMYDPKNERLKS